MTWSDFNALSTDEKIKQTKQNGVKFRVDWASTDDGRQPKAFSQFPDCYYHYVGEDTDVDGAVLWVNPEYSPSSSVSAIVDADPPIIDILEDNR